MKKAGIALAGCLLILAVAAGAFFLSLQSGRNGRAILYQVRHDVYYSLVDGNIQENWDDSWNTYIVVVEDQFDEPDSMTLHFSRDEEHLILLYTEEGSINGRYIFGAGTHTVPFSQSDSYLYIAVHDEEAAELNMMEGGTENSGEGKYKGKYLSVLGDSISSFEGYISEGCLAGYNEGYDMRVSDMWWYEMARLCGMNICTINASGGSGVTDLGDPQYKGNGDRATALDVPGCTPDVICVLLGINDFFNGVDYDQFTQEYTEMVQTMKGEYPDAEIFLCTYFELPGDYKAGVDDLNAIVAQIASEQGVQVLDLHGCELASENAEDRFTDYNEETGGAVHPNAVGQKIMGRWGASLLNGTAEE